MNKKYQIIYADPPYPIRWVNVPTKSGFKGLDYPTMGIAEMCNLPVRGISETCSKCFVWTTNHFLLEGLFLIRSWGFQYDKLWVWCKPTGAGGHPRTATEYIVEGTRGLLKSIGQHEKAVNNWFVAPTGKHSEKPQYAVDLIEHCYPNYSKIELFARKKRLGWDCWGNEVESDIDLSTIWQRREERMGNKICLKCGKEMQLVKFEAAGRTIGWYWICELCPQMVNYQSVEASELKEAPD